MRNGSERPCHCSICERPRILAAWQAGLTWRLIELHYVATVQIRDGLQFTDGPRS